MRADRDTRAWTKLVGVVLGTLLVAGAAEAGGAVQMPKEGSYEFQFCYIGRPVVPIAVEQLTVVHYSVEANILTEPAGRPFDRQSARCWGVDGVVKGKSEHFGFCEIVDQDGDKWYMEYHGNPEDTGGTYTAPYGTGKYQGMSLNGAYQAAQWPAASSATVHGCNPNTGTYTLR
jgi:hypothetical protein